MTWKLRGDVLIACNCEWGCPCNFNGVVRSAALAASRVFRVKGTVSYDRSG